LRAAQHHAREPRDVCRVDWLDPAELDLWGRSALELRFQPVVVEQVESERAVRDDRAVRAQRIADRRERIRGRERQRRTLLIRLPDVEQRPDRKRVQAV
jgi:hypothetical protein